VATTGAVARGVIEMVAWHTVSNSGIAAALLALGAALFIGIGNVLHQRAAHAVTTEPVGNFELFLRLLRDWPWWRGSLIAAIGFACQAAALGLGSVLLVQALMVTSLLFALVLNARWTHRRVAHSEWVWAALLAVSVTVIVIVGKPTPGASRGTLHIWLLVAAVIVPLMIACLIGARIWSGPVSAVLIALVSGTWWGIFSVLTKGIVELVGDGPMAVLRSPELYGFALAALAGTAWQQAAFRAGALTASLPTLTVTEPMVGSILGVVVLGETLHPGRAGWAVLVVTVAVMVVATARLARVEADSVEHADDPVPADGAG
jgi:drug/metabolite transporter (DMT)-like permease